MIFGIVRQGIWDTIYFTFRDMGYSVTFRDKRYLEKNDYGDIYQLIRDTRVFTSRDVGYW